MEIRFVCARVGDPAEIQRGSAYVAKRANESRLTHLVRAAIVVCSVGWHQELPATLGAEQRLLDGRLVHAASATLSGVRTQICMICGTNRSRSPDCNHKIKSIHLFRRPMP